MRAGFTWIFHACYTTHDHVVLNISLPRAHIDVPQWIADQKHELTLIKNHFGSRVHTRADGLTTVEGKVIVPKTQVQALVAYYHEFCAHARPARLLSLLQATYTWKGMRADVMAILARCKACSLTKAKITKATALYRPLEYSAPRRAYGIDTYGVGTAADGSKYVLVVVDLFSRWVHFAPMPDRTAETFVKVFLKDIVFTRGKPLWLMSDGAPEFLGRISRGLFEALGTLQRITRYWSAANGMPERAQYILGETFRLLKPEERRYWPVVCARLGLVTNSCIAQTTTEISASQVETGSNSLMPFATAFTDSVTPAEDFNSPRKVRGVYGVISERIKLYTRICTRNSTSARISSNAKLNSHGRARTYKLKDTLVMYCPQDGEDGWKAKHTLQWKYVQVVEVISPTTYRLKEISSGRTYQRHVSLLSDLFVDPTVDSEDRTDPASRPSLSLAEPFCVNDVVATLDQPDDTTFWLGKVMALSEDSLEVHYMATTGSDLKSAIFKEVWIETNSTGRSILGKPRNGEKANPWTGEVSSDPDIVVLKIKLTCGGRITAESRRALQELGLRHKTLS